MDEIDTIASIIENVRNENYNYFNKSDSNNIEKFEIMVKNYVGKVLKDKTNGVQGLEEKIKSITKRIVEHITGDYEIGLGEQTFEEMDLQAESIANIIGYSEKSEIEEIMSQNQGNEMADVLVDGSFASGIIPVEEENENKAKENFLKSPENLKSFFMNSIKNIVKVNEKMANLLAHLAGMDKEESAGLNNNIAGKFIGGLGYEFLSGTLIGKRHFTSIQNSPSMQKLIKDEGILHFTSPSNIEKILESGRIKPANFMESDCTAKKSFFFAGTPKFEDLLINIPAYDVMTAIRVKPTEEQMQDLKYRALNDRAVTMDGALAFEGNQVDVAYFGLQYNKEKNSIFLGEISKEEAENFQVSDEVRNAYRYKPKGNSFKDAIKMNAYGLYAEYKHHQSLLRMENEMKNRGITSFRDVSDADLVRMDDIEEAYIETKDKSVERKGLIDNIKERINKQRQINDREENLKNEPEL